MKHPKQTMRFLLPGAGWARVANGRVAWALAELLRAGKRGVTPIDNPGPRWSAYIFTLRTEYGLDIETVNEPHGGPYPGTHARYVLKSRIEVVE
ncbi:MULTISPECIES: winged helix domain-containing protein [Thalassospira]|uniref:Winged helix domain-containing protein n=1 Tax=Thalassospira aquimaris TaxID=3037796 RepID=A0ABT6G6X9_9PROT|nr:MULTISPECIES: hypothetical protein [Thalassospira]MDG4717796.1 hypothetical protein [Thalassospira sp. FZY0004]